MGSGATLASPGGQRMGFGSPPPRDSSAEREYTTQVEQQVQAGTSRTKDPYFDFQLGLRNKWTWAPLAQGPHNPRPPLPASGVPAGRVKTSLFLIQRGWRAVSAKDSPKLRILGAEFRRRYGSESVLRHDPCVRS